MIKKEYEKMLKEIGPRRMIGRYVNNLIKLNCKQINNLIKLKNMGDKQNVRKKKLQTL